MNNFHESINAFSPNSNICKYSSTLEEHLLVFLSRDSFLKEVALKIEKLLYKIIKKYMFINKIMQKVNTSVILRKH